MKRTLLIIALVMSLACSTPCSAAEKEEVTSEQSMSLEDWLHTEVTEEDAHTYMLVQLWIIFMLALALFAFKSNQ